LYVKQEGSYKTVLWQPLTYYMQTDISMAKGFNQICLTKHHR